MYGIPKDLFDWLTLLGVAVAAWVIAEVIFFVVQRVVQRAVRRSPLLVAVTKAARQPAHWTMRLVALTLVWQGAPDGLPGLANTARWTGILLIGVITWFAVRCVHGASQAVIDAHPVTVADNLAARRVHTQTQVIAKTLTGMLMLIGAALMLMTFPAVRQIGASLLASAGVVGIVAGLAARPVLGNLIAGLQIGLTQPIRLDDVVIVEGEWGVIEEITGTYVVVRIWDQRRLVVPLQWWIEHPFQNWTRTSSDLIGTVFLWVDYRMPLAPLRDALQKAVEATDLWDRRVVLLQVTENGERAMQLRCLVSAASAPKAWDLRCHVREWLIDFVQREYPEYLPRLRAEVDGESPPGPATTGASAITAGASPLGAAQ